MNKYGRMPAAFLGHGNPMNTLWQNAYTEAWQALGRSVPKPRAVLVVSAHWFLRGTKVTAMARPRTIHDFRGFPRELNEFVYPVAGEPDVAERVRKLLAPVDVELDSTWGLDHGSWSVLAHVFPAADVPVLQLSVNESQPPSFHYELGKRLAPLRDEGILIIGSGNVVHNLGTADFYPQTEPYDWAVRFNGQAREILLQGDHQKLVNYTELGDDALLAIPTPDHFFPLLYVLGLQQESDSMEFLVDGIEHGSISMLALSIG